VDEESQAIEDLHDGSVSIVFGGENQLSEAGRPAGAGAKLDFLQRVGAVRHDAPE
jgi:hypothetical protein